MSEVLNAKANKAIHGNFVAEIVKMGEEFLVSVKHHNSDEDPCAGQSQVVSELYKALGACDLDKAGSVSHSGGCASVKAKKQQKQIFNIDWYETEMTANQAKRWNDGDLNADDEKEMLVYIPIPGNHYKLVKFCDLDEEIRDFLEGREAVLNPYFSKMEAIKMIIAVMNDGSRIDRFLKKSDSGVFFVSDDSEGGIKLPVCHDGEPTEEDAEHFINQLN